MRRVRRSEEHGQATIAGIGIVLAAIALAAIVLQVAQVYLAREQLQTAADVAAAAAGLAGEPNTPTIERVRSLARANGAAAARIEIDDKGRAWVVVDGEVPVGFGVGVRTISARAQVEAAPRSPGGTGPAGAGPMYTGTLVAVDGARVCPAVASDYRSMQAAAAATGVSLWAVSGYRTVAEQASLFAQLGPGLAAPPGSSLHHRATELDIAVGSAGSPVHSWLTLNASAFGFVQRYSWEPWHWGNVRGC